jgi:dihydroneopterin aldolase
MVTTEPVNLLETLAENIAAAVFEHARTSGVAVETVEVTVHKPQAPLSVTFADVSVTVVRNRP